MHVRQQQLLELPAEPRRPQHPGHAQRKALGHIVEVLLPRLPARHISLLELLPIRLVVDGGFRGERVRLLRRFRDVLRPSGLRQREPECAAPGNVPLRAHAVQVHGEVRSHSFRQDRAPNLLMQPRGGLRLPRITVERLVDFVRLRQVIHQGCAFELLIRRRELLVRHPGAVANRRRQRRQLAVRILEGPEQLVDHGLGNFKRLALHLPDGQVLERPREELGKLRPRGLIPGVTRHQTLNFGFRQHAGPLELRKQHLHHRRPGHLVLPGTVSRSPGGRILDGVPALRHLIQIGHFPQGGLQLFAQLRGRAHLLPVTSRLGRLISQVRQPDLVPHLSLVRGRARRRSVRHASVSHCLAPLLVRLRHSRDVSGLYRRVQFRFRLLQCRQLLGGRLLRSSLFFPSLFGGRRDRSPGAIPQNVQRLRAAEGLLVERHQILEQRTLAGFVPRELNERLGFLAEHVGVLLPEAVDGFVEPERLILCGLPLQLKNVPGLRLRVLGVDRVQEPTLRRRQPALPAQALTRVVHRGAERFVHHESSHAVDGRHELGRLLLGRGLEDLLGDGRFIVS